MSNWNAHLILPNKSINNDKNQNEIELKIFGGNDDLLEKKRQKKRVSGLG